MNFRKKFDLHLHLQKFYLISPTKWCSVIVAIHVQKVGSFQTIYDMLIFGMVIAITLNPVIVLPWMYSGVTLFVTNNDEVGLCSTQYNIRCQCLSSQSSLSLLCLVLARYVVDNFMFFVECIDTAIGYTILFNLWWLDCLICYISQTLVLFVNVDITVDVFYVLFDGECDC